MHLVFYFQLLFATTCRKAQLSSNISKCCLFGSFPMKWKVSPVAGIPNLPSFHLLLAFQPPTFVFQACTTRFHLGKYPTVAEMKSGSSESPQSIRHSAESCLRVLELEHPTWGESPSEPIQPIPNAMLPNLAHLNGHLQCAFSLGPCSITALEMLLWSKLPLRLSQTFCAHFVLTSPGSSTFWSPMLTYSSEAITLVALPGPPSVGSETLAQVPSLSWELPQIISQNPPPPFLCVRFLFPY